jgi:hypothetical protein
MQASLNPVILCQVSLGSAQSQTKGKTLEEIEKSFDSS